MRELSLSRPLVWLLSATVSLAALGAWLWTGKLRASEGLDDRRALLEALSPAEKEELLAHQKRFLRLEPAEQQRLRELHAKIEEDPQGAELRRVMQSYYDWLKPLPFWQQAELNDNDRPTAQRIVAIKKVLEEQRRRNVGRLGFGEIARADWRGSGFTPSGGGPRLNPQDVEGLLEWIGDYARRQGPQFLEKLPESKRRELEQLSRGKDDVRRNEILGMMWLRWQLDHPANRLAVGPRDLAELRAKLSPETRSRLESKSVQDQWRNISGMASLYMFRQYVARRGEPRPPTVNEEELAEFFEKELTAQQRDELLKLPSDEMQRVLWRRYGHWKFSKGQGGAEGREGSAADGSEHGNRREGREKPPERGPEREPPGPSGGPPGLRARTDSSPGPSRLPADRPREPAQGEPKP